MKSASMFRRSVLAVTWAALVAAAQFPGDALSQPGWRPEKAVEFLTSSGAGGSNDRIARAIQKVVQDEKLSPAPIAIVNKPGGNQILAPTYLSQKAGDAHFLLLANPTVFSNHIAGLTPLNYTDFTVIATLLNEHTLFTVSADSPIKNTKELFDKLRADPGALSIGIVSRGGPNHLTLSVAAKHAGVDARKLKVVVFKTNAESMTAMLGGHVQMVASSVSSAIAHVQSGKARMLAIAAPKRMGGELAAAPTLAEQGINVTLSSWRAVLAPKGLKPAEIAFWENALARAVATDDWKEALEQFHWAGHFLRSQEALKHLEAEYRETRAIMVELGLAK